LALRLERKGKKALPREVEGGREREKESDEKVFKVHA
jgi:hypothetical protein